MKKAIVIAVLAGLIAGAFAIGPAEAKKKKKKKKPVAVERVERVMELAYQCPCGVHAGPAGQGFWATGGLGGGPTPTGTQELFLSAEVLDQSGQDVYVQLAQNTDGDNIAETPVGTFCGKTTEPLPIPAPGAELGVFIYDGVCNDGGVPTGPSVALGGTVKLTFSNMP